jgi:RecB family exonuclease
VRLAAFPATAQEHRLRALLDHATAGQVVTSHPLCATDRVLGLGVDATTSRASARFTRFDGNLENVSIESPARPGYVVSPTRLEAWAACPHSYLMQSILRVEIPERPEEVYEISALDRGSLVHEVLDEFLREVLHRNGGPPGANERWSPADHVRMQEIGSVCCDAYEARGLTGRAVYWARDRGRILAELDRFLYEDDRARDELALVPVATEMRFGFADERESGAPIAVPLRDGRVLHFRGAADRVDRAGDGSLLVVDYKTGKVDSYKGISEADPDQRGTRLQLPVYAHAARARYGEASTLVEAAYWFVSARGEYRRITLPLTDAVAARVDAVLATVVDGIEHGVFPCRTDAPTTTPWRNRDFVDPDGRGTRDRYRDWLRKRGAPELADYVALAEPDGEGEPPEPAGEVVAEPLHA